MKVTFAVDHGKHKAGSTVDVADHEARDLLHTGRARSADETPKPSAKSDTK